MPSPTLTAAQICTWSANNLMSFWIPAAVSAIGGVLGGIAEFVTHLKVAGDKVLYDDQEASASNLKLMRRYSAVIGWAGAWGVLVILVATRWWDSEAQKSSLALF